MKDGNRLNLYEQFFYSVFPFSGLGASLLSGAKESATKNEGAEKFTKSEGRQ